MGSLAQRVLDRWAQSNEIPVKNRETGRTVYVLPETLKEEPDRFQKLRPSEVGDPRWRGKPKPPRRPRKPERAEIPVDPPPAPIRPPVPPKPPKPPKPVSPVPMLKLPKVPEPSPFREWRTEKRFQASAESVVQKYLD
jgi:hypothetical protein